MKRTLRIVLIGSLFALVAAQLPAQSSGAPEANQPSAKIQRTAATLKHKWQMVQGSGPELYRVFCSSCHGLEAKGNVAVARALGVPPPDLTRLQESGVSSQHVRYVLQSSCSDDHHRAPDGTQTMPCWRRVFRNVLGTDAAALPVINRLVDYIDSIQQTGEPEPPVLVAAANE